jgi:hypothetical protein
MEALEIADLRAVPHAHSLHHLAPGAARGLAAVGRALVTVKLDDRQRAAVGG